MTGRMLLGVLAGLLLPVPLILVLATVLFPRPQPQRLEDPRFSPMLTEEERMSLQTYRRDCRKHTDCEPPLGCLLDTRIVKAYCTDSQCVLDAQCPAGFSCRPLLTTENGPLVRYCIPHGLREEGEPCFPTPSDQQSACAEGLLCSRGWCGRPCQLDKPTSCPAGFSCADSPLAPACLPTCEGRTCPEGQRCVRDDRGGASVCAMVYGQDCQRSTCAEGQKCVAVFSAKTQMSAWIKCWPECGKDLPACAPGMVCHRKMCRKPCEPDGPNVCEPGYRCQRPNEEQPWLCHADM